MISYYQDQTGDFLAIDTSTNAYYRQNCRLDHFQTRAAAIAGEVDSICTVGISREFLKIKCRRVAKAKVPAVWRDAIGYDDEPQEVADDLWEVAITTGH